MRCLLNPLFNRKTFVVVLLLASAAIYLMSFELGLPPDMAPESAETIEEAGGLVKLETPYEHGFRKGYDAFLKQTGQYIPRPSFSSRRVASYSSEDEEVSRGYVDGYHKATQIEQCPRGFFD